MFEKLALGAQWLTDRLSRRRKEDRRGIALVIVMATVAILSTSVIEFAYQTNVNLFIAANARDEFKASYMARSGMNLAILLLDFQFELEKDPLIGRFMRNSNFQLYPMINLFLTPFSTGQLTTPVGGINLNGGGATGFGGFHGSFEVEVEPEEGKLNLNAFSKGSNQGQMTWLCLLFNGEQNEDLFDSEIGESDGIRRSELVGNIADWVDPDKTKALLSEFCVPEGAGNGDEGAAYSRADVDYEPKNARFTTIEELRLVEGVNDAVFERFADSFTVYPVDKVNLNLANFLVLQSLLCSHVNGASLDNWPCRDPAVFEEVALLAMALDGLREFFANPLNVLLFYMNPENGKPLQAAKRGQTVAYINTRQLIRYIREFQSNPLVLQTFLSYSPTAQGLLGPLGIQAVGVRPLQTEFNERNLLRNVTTESPKIFKVVAQGSYGDASKTLVSVVDFSKKKARYLYWREY